MPTEPGLDARIAALTAAVEHMTPGPWTYRPYEHDDWGLIRSADGTSGIDGFLYGKPLFTASIAPYPEAVLADCRERGKDPAGPDAEGIVALRNDALPLIRQLRERLAAVEGELGKLAKFKAYVHKRLDDADVPNHPNPKTHDGCRIGARLDWCEANRKALANQINLLTHKVITCGVAASHPDAELTRRLKCYAEDWNSPQAEEVRALRAERDEIKQQLAVQDDAYKLLYDRVLMHDEAAVSAAIALIQRHQPDGSPPPGNWLSLLQWVLEHYRLELARLRDERGDDDTPGKADDTPAKAD